MFQQDGGSIPPPKSSAYLDPYTLRPSQEVSAEWKKFPFGEKIISMSAGLNTSGVVTGHNSFAHLISESGKVFLWETEGEPQEISLTFPVKEIALSATECLVLTEEGKLFRWSLSIERPLPLKESPLPWLSTHKVGRVSLGWDFGLAVVSPISK